MIAHENCGIGARSERQHGAFGVGFSFEDRIAAIAGVRKLAKVKSHMVDTGFLNGLRALAAFCVLTCHCMIWSAWPGFGLPSIVPGPGLASKLAVDLFMLISGLLMVFVAHE